MAIELNHTIVPAHDNEASAAFLAEILGLPVGEQVGPFVRLRLSNGVTLDFMNRDVSPQHYAFLVEESAFDAVRERLAAAGVRTYADPGHQQPDEINTECGGRGLYFSDPAGHNMEILTQPG